MTRKATRFVAGLNGLFSGLLIDRARRHVLLFNDRYGSERIYAFDEERRRVLRQRG